MRVLLTKLGLDGHDRAIRMIAFELRNQGVEVILSGTGTSAKHAAAVAEQEDVDVVAVSLLSGSHMILIPTLIELLREAGLTCPVVCGGLMTPKDAVALRKTGAIVIPSGCSVQQAAQSIISAGTQVDQL